MNEKIVIIGGGIAGISVAISLSESEKFDLITIIEKGKLGGTCLNTGCIPTKSLIHSSSNLADSANLSKSTKRKSNKSFNENMAFSKKNVELLRNAVQNLIRRKKIDLINDEAVVESENTLLLKNSKKKLEFDILIIAAGSESIIPPKFRDANVNDSDNVNDDIIGDVITTDSILELKELPDKLLIVGGGHIGVEMATIFHNLGSKVTVYEKEESLLPSMKNYLSSELEDSFRKKRIKIICNTGIKEINKSESTVIFKNNETVVYDKILLAVGRKPRQIVSKIKLETKLKAGSETGYKNIYRIGDSAGGLMLAHKAEYEARVLASNLISNKHEKPDYTKIPIIVYTNPQICIIGDCNQDQDQNNNKNQNKNLKSIKIPFSAASRPYCDENTQGFIKIFADENNVLVGAEVVNSKAEEILSALTVIIDQKMSCKKVSELVFAHPSMAEIIKMAAKRMLKG